MSMVCWAGNVGQAIQWRDHEGYGGCATFSLAVTPRVRNSDGSWAYGVTTWVKVTAWRLLGEHVRDSLNKGDAVLVYGRLDTRRWTDDNGHPRDELSIEATYVGHDLRRGLSSFQRTGRPAPETAPRFETRNEAELAALEAAEEAALRGTVPAADPAAAEVAV